MLHNSEPVKAGKGSRVGAILPTRSIFKGRWRGSLIIFILALMNLDKI